MFHFLTLIKIQLSQTFQMIITVFSKYHFDKFEIDFVILVWKLNKENEYYIILNNRSLLEWDIMKGYKYRLYFLMWLLKRYQGVQSINLLILNILPTLTYHLHSCLHQTLHSGWAKRRLNNLQKKAWITFYSCQLIL